MAIEASDAAVFLIALHWTVYIFRSHRAAGESGIYPYRFLAFGFYIVVPALIASLAYLTRFPAYVDTGQYCYLPAKPWWIRLSLSWIPRFINMTLIIFMYGASYLYIRKAMRHFSRQHASATTSHREGRIQDTPPLVRHGLLPSPAESRRISFRIPTSGSLDEGIPHMQGDDGLGTRGSMRYRLDRLSVSSMRSRRWQWKGLDWDADMGAQPPSSGLVSPRTGAAEQTMDFTAAEYRLKPPRPSLSTLKLARNIEALPVRPPLSRDLVILEFYRRPISETIGADERYEGKGVKPNRDLHCNGSQMHIYTVLQQGPSPESEGDPTPSTPIASLDYETLESDGLSRGRDRIRRQLRLLFIYPAVYACVWVFPLVNEVVSLDENHNSSPYWILVASLVSLCVQGLADTTVFCLRERPWRYMKGGFWENLGMGFMNGLSFESRNEIGRTREEMFHDGSRARLRREEEREREQRASRLSPGYTSEVSVSRNWWDVELNNESDVESRVGKGESEGEGEGEEGQVQVKRDDRGSMHTG